jgi:hypothetical protein
MSSSEKTENFWPAYRIIAVVSTSCAGLAVILIGLHCFDEQIEPEYIHVNSETIPGHVHHVCQLFGYFCFIHAILAHRLYHFSGYIIRKIVHITSHILCLASLTVGIVYMAVSKNSVKNSSGKYESNLYSLHSFLAIAGLCVYLFQFIGGIVAFRGGVSSSLFKRMSGFHREVGIFILTAMTMVVTSGIMNLFNRKDCMAATSSHADKNPYSSYKHMRKDCQMLNAIGLLVYIAAFSASLAITKSDFKDVWEALTKPV